MAENIARKLLTRPRRGPAELLADRDGPLPVWVRSPKRGVELYSGCSRAKLYQWAAEGKIRSVALREPGRTRGCRLFHLGSILDFIDRQGKEGKP